VALRDPLTLVLTVMDPLDVAVADAVAVRDTEIENVALRDGDTL
jgi:hypothetical protein